MPKKKKNLTPEEAREVKLRKLKKAYDYADEELKLEEKYVTVTEKVHALIDMCDELMNKICEMSDDIKINDLERVQELTPIDKKTYLDFVAICSRRNNDTLKDKAIDKFAEDFAKRLLITNLRHSFLESYMNGEDLKITDEDNEEFKPFTDYKSDEFDKIMNESANKREYINTILWHQYKTYAKAAEYITNLELNYKDFKNLVDWQHYKNGGYPSPTSPSKIWSIFDKFNYAHRVLTKWGYDNTADELKTEFGLIIEETEPNPVEHPWMIIDKDKENE